MSLHFEFPDWLVSSSYIRPFMHLISHRARSHVLYIFRKILVMYTGVHFTIQSNLNVLKILGNFGSINKGTLKKDNNERQTVAMKTLHSGYSLLRTDSIILKSRLRTTYILI